MKTKQIVFYHILYVIVLITAGCQNGSNEEENYNSNLEILAEEPDSGLTSNLGPLEEKEEYDTLRQGDNQLLFKPLNKVTDADNATVLNNEVSLAGDYDDYYEKVLENERNLARKYKKYFKVNAKEISIKLTNGRTVKFPRWDGEYGFNLEHYFPETNYVLMYVQHEEGNSWLLMNRKNGFQKDVEGKPYFSPDGKKVLTANVDLESGYSFNGFECFDVQGDTLEKRFAIATKDWGPQDVKWVTNSSADIAKAFMVLQNNQIVYQTTYVRMFIDEK